MVVEPEQWICGPTLLIVLLEVRLFLRVSSVVGLQSTNKLVKTPYFQ